MGQGAKSAGRRRPPLRAVAGGRRARTPARPQRGRALALSLVVFAAVFGGGYFGPPLLDRLARRAEVVRAASYYPSCEAAHADGVYSILVGAPAYRRELDADQDGIACEPWPAAERKRKTPLD